MFDLSGRVALVTGAGQGVGAAVARTLADAGAAVAVNDLFADRAEDVVGSIRGTGADARALAVAADVTDPAAVAAMIESTRDGLGQVDILVNNAGIPPSAQWLIPFRDTDPAGWQRWIDLNLYAVLHCTHAVVGPMCDAGWGRIVTIVSDAARVGEPNMAIYSAAKAGAAGFVRALAREVGRDGVTANCVSLGNLGPPTGAEPTPEMDAFFDKLARRYPVGRVGGPDDVAPIVLYLASNEAEWVTGQTYSVNGGIVTS